MDARRLPDADVAAIAAAALLMASIGWTRHAMLSATVLLTTPRILFQIEQGWTEPFAVFLLATMAAIMARTPRKGSVALGLTMAVKQYLAIALVLLPLLPHVAVSAPRKRLTYALAAGAAVTLPFVIWDPYGFANSVVLLQFREPFRADSLSFLAWLARLGIDVPPLPATLAAAVAAAVLARRTLRPSVGGFSTGLALVTFAMFAFGKKAFCNYYFFVLGALAVAIAATGGATDARHEPSG